MCKFRVVEYELVNQRIGFHVSRAIVLVFFFVACACSNRVMSPVLPSATTVGHQRSIFVGTTRAKEDNDAFGYKRSHSLDLLEFGVSIPEKRNLGSISDGLDNPRPGRDFVLTTQKEFTSRQDFRQSVWDAVEVSGTRGGKDATVYVHGYNTSFSETVFRVAQLTHDLNIEGPAITFSWPSRANPLGYEYDVDSALFARDGLVELLREVKAAGIKRIVLVAHSLGSSLVMESLRQLELSNPGWAKENLAGVLLISPDLNVDVFRSQAAAFQAWPQPFVVFSSRRDIVLRLSARLRGERSRLGNLGDVAEISDLPISFVDVTELAEGAESQHFVAGTSEAFVRIVRSADDLDQAFVRGTGGAGMSLLGLRRVSERATQITLVPGER